MIETDSKSCAVAFKEWSAICQALASGRQSIILRKGGIAEESGTFKPEHNRFWLFPTFVHQQSQGVKVEGILLPDALSRPEFIPIQHLVEAERVYHCISLPILHDLEAYHIWTSETVEKRFHYREPGVYVLVVKVSSLPKPVMVPNDAHYDGCKTWVNLAGAIETTELTAVLPGKMIQDRLFAIDRILEPAILA